MMLEMLQRCRSIAFTLAFYVTTALFLVFGSPLLLGPRGWAMAGLKLHGRVCNWLLRLIAGTRTEIRGLENLPPPPYLIVAKHQSAWDTFALIPLFSDPAIVLKHELTRIPVYGQFCRKFAHIIVDRDRGPAALRLMVEDARARAADGREILIFAEGTRTEPGAAPDYKPGFTALYSGLDIPCVPLALNSGLYWPARRDRHYAGTITVEIGPPIPPGRPRKDVQSELIAWIERASNRLIDEAAGSADPPPTLAEAQDRQHTRAK